MNIYRDRNDNRIYRKLEGSIEEILPMFPPEEWNCVEAYDFAGVKGYEPMTAKEIETEESQEEALSSRDNIIEEKFDGTRGILQFFSQEDISGIEEGYCRVFSRRISKKTGFYVENTDSVPHLRDINVPSLAGTVIDGEMFINGQPFKEVSSTLNCLWDKAVDRQIDKGFISLHAFDIIKYRGIDLRRMPLIRRKKYLDIVVREANSPYIEMVPYYECGNTISQIPNFGKGTSYISAHATMLKYVGEYNEDQLFDILEEEKEVFPELYRCLKGDDRLTPRAYYELIVCCGGEGVIVKSKNGRYHHKRGREYQKIKKILTRECILMGFTEPTDLYTGKFPNDRWSYWIDKNDERVSLVLAGNTSANQMIKEGYTPVTRFHYYHMIGNIRYGVIITDEEVSKLSKSKKFNIQTMTLEGEECKVIEVGDCAGFDDDMRDTFSFTWVNKKTKEIVKILPGEESHNTHITQNSDWEKLSFEGAVVEIMANELFKDTGKMRHPRFLRMRPDKSALSCTWKEHVQ